MMDYVFELHQLRHASIKMNLSCVCWLQTHYNYVQMKLDDFLDSAFVMRKIYFLYSLQLVLTYYEFMVERFISSVKNLVSSRNSNVRVMEEYCYVLTVTKNKSSYVFSLTEFNLKQDGCCFNC